jgi:tetratricopeptide (TPR) repeat protein
VPAECERVILLSADARCGYSSAMPSNPGAKKAQEKAKKKRAEAQKARAQQLARAKERAPKVEEESAPPQDDGSPFGLRGQGVIDFDELDELSAEAAVLIKKKKIDEAARVCADMVRKFPNEPDGWQRFAAVWEARGELSKAVADLERAEARASEEDAGTVQAIELELERLRKTVARGR